mmetsp:Transcript_20307/g.27466  ORF Transcript_20307/g.27466 Transcript_20307/m.27466 type:complete len:101 (+) Transcript_20307:426-728(+)|eukprot:CAMPEP_0185591442 /NCGR_PEP_ID=MMETSP0434-20130131/64588_1 /TAXON_ID=626734 ORGANISM="Favella taraikaensis, Strain Fe Narragansett Bay" /NCGR_SAMPLE_ID=MMETSP0434 /ASSEMBLY_ACC=CAM_ASM_000379 /LENGTH=100 /DNA_ID=CAMNT_0028216463 /DNA_START=419 /DNA_END=721 /DNA_ORIENTATION=+
MQAELEGIIDGTAVGVRDKLSLEVGDMRPSPMSSHSTSNVADSKLDGAKEATPKLDRSNIETLSKSSASVKGCCIDDELSKVLEMENEDAENDEEEEVES